MIARDEVLDEEAAPIDGRTTPPPPVTRRRLRVRDLRDARAADVLSRRVVTISGAATAAEAVRRMRAEGVSSLVVERRHAADAWGIVSRSDVIRKVVTACRELEDVRVHDIMTKPVVTVSPGLAVKFCLRLMDMARVRRAVVFDGHELVGVLSRGDVFAALEA